MARARRNVAVATGGRTAAREPLVPLGVHLVGSVPLPNAEDVFRMAGRELGDRLRRVPDGETGPRADWIVWQYPVLSSRPQFEVGPPDLNHYRALPRSVRGRAADAAVVPRVAAAAPAAG